MKKPKTVTTMEQNISWGETRYLVLKTANNTMGRVGVALYTS
jgi:hypothetical protein